MLNSSGSPILTIDQPAQPGFDSDTPAVVVLSPGGRAYFSLVYYMNAEAPPVNCPSSAELELTPPGLVETLTLSAAITPYGDSSTPCGLIMVTPVEVTIPFPHPSGS